VILVMDVLKGNLMKMPHLHKIALNGIDYLKILKKSVYLRNLYFKASTQLARNMVKLKPSGMHLLCSFKENDISSNHILAEIINVLHQGQIKDINRT